MKKSSISIIILAAAAALTLSCAKEAAPEQTPEAAKSEVSGGHTFTATMGQDTKVNIADDGACTWKAGDYILVFNGYGALEGSTEHENVGYDTSADNKYQFNGKAFGWGAATITYDGEIVAESIKVTDDMISADGKSLTFTTQVAEPTSDHYSTNWYFIAMSDWSMYAYAFFRNDGSVNWYAIQLYRIQSQTVLTSSERSILCWGECPVGKESFTLYHHDSQLRFTCSSTDYDQVTFEANGDASASNCINPNRKIYPKRVASYGASTWSSTYQSYYEYDRSTDKYSDGTNQCDKMYVTLSGNADDVYYVPVPADYTWANGITITLLKDGTAVKTLTINKSITTTHGQIINFGDLASVTPAKTYTSYYEMWEDGKAITIGDTKFDPADYSDWTVKHITADATKTDVFVNNSTSVICFISPDAKVTWDAIAYPATGSFVFIGDEIGTRSNMVFTNRFVPKGGVSLVAFKNLNVSTTSASDASVRNYNGFVQAADGAVTTAIVDDCQVDLTLTYGNGSFLSGSNGGWQNIVIMDSDFIFPGYKDSGIFTNQNGALIAVNRGDSVSGGRIVFTNNLCYTSDGKSPYYFNSSNTQLKLGCGVFLGSANSTFHSIDVENNTFIGAFYEISLFKTLTDNQLVDTDGSLTIENNLCYAPGDDTENSYTSLGFTSYFKIVQLTSAFTVPTTVSSTDRTTNWGWASLNPGRFQTYGDRGAKTFSADPFDTSDGATYEPSTGTFVLSATAKSAAGSVGASR